MNKKEIKEFEKTLTKELRAAARQKGYKTIADLHIYIVKNNWYFNSFVSVAGNTLSVKLTVKPMGLDEIFWDVFEIPENANAPISLRSNGAFVAPTYPIDRLAISIIDASTDVKIANILDWISTQIDQFSSLYKGNDISSFLALVKKKEPFYKSILIKILLFILEEDYSKAIELLNSEIEKGTISGFSASALNRRGTKDFYVFALEYCNERLLHHC